MLRNYSFKNNFFRAFLAVKLLASLATTDPHETQLANTTCADCFATLTKKHQKLYLEQKVLVLVSEQRQEVTHDQVHNLSPKLSL